MATREEVASELQAVVERAEALAARLDQKDLECPTCEGGWTVKEVFAHLASMGGSPGFFLAMAQRAQSGGGSGGGGLGAGFDIDAFNAQQVSARKEKTLKELLDEFRQGHEQGIAMIRSAADDLLSKQMPDPFRGGMSTPLEMIKGSCCEHEAAHLDEVEAALKR
ncbi:MAG: DinB family protein [Dehalococcoidia bacterium]|nr:DinB family protein [Dehalococcoidia bacterium]